MITDARRLDGDLDADLCLVGGGPAAIAIARRLSGSGLRVVVLESGDLATTLAGQRLNAGALAGHDYWPLASCRARSLGGSANFWGGWCRPLDPIDLESWPISHEEHRRTFAATNEFLGLPPESFPEGRLEDLPTSPVATEAGLEAVVYRFSRFKQSLGAAYRTELEQYADVTVALNATVRELRLGADRQQVSHAVVARDGAAPLTVRARRFVLAAGAIENARLLLASTADRPAGLGNEHDQVGRCFMEHVHAHVGYLDGTGTGLDDPAFTRISHAPLGVACAALGSPADRRVAEGLLGLSLTITLNRERFGQDWRLRLPRGVGLVAYDRKRRYREGADVATDDPPRRVRRLRPEPTDDSLALYLRGEQLPNPSSRVTLGTRRDRFGVPLPVLDWRLSEADLASAHAWLDRLPAVRRRPGWDDAVEGGPHHMGTTRMSADPHHGVVDPDLRVHSIPNLYVAGASVFATCGYANPTYSLVALSLRLADHLLATRPT